MKRLLHRLALVGLAAVVLTLGGCDLTEMNENPNASTQANPSELLTNAEIDLGNLYWRDYAGAFWMRYAQHLTTNQYTTADRFGFPSRRSGANNFNWNQAYFILNDLEQIKRLNRDPEVETSGFGSSDHQIAMAKILQAWIFQFLTDIWGPIPFDEALKGQTEGVFSPSYASQEAVYTALLDSLDDANARIQDTDATSLAAGDIIYGGDMGKWKKFANALRMRIAMRMSDRDPSTASTVIQNAISAGTFESNEDAALVPFNSSPPYQNPIYENYQQGRDDWAAPEPLVNVMNDNDDPRRPAYFTDANPNQAGNQFNGFPYGLQQEEAQPLFTDPSEHFSRPSQRVRQPDFPAILLPYDEVLFIQAEAALRGDMSFPGDADQLYSDAITASMEFWGVSESDITTYLGNIPMPSDGGFDRAQNLGVQKWVAQYMQGVQPWSTWRRLDFQGVLQVPPGNPGQDAFGREIAVRMDYPNDEATLNGANLEEAVNNQLGGPDNQGTLLWWDVEYQSP